MIKTKKQMFIVIGVFTLVMMLGTVTFAFFNYTRTGAANTIRTGNINFESSQGTPINLTNMFPIDPTETGVMNDATKVGTVTINVTGNTSYDEGIEYLVSAVNVTNSVGSGANAKSLPISINVSVASNTTNDPATTLGTSDTEYFTNRGGSDSIYKVLAEDTISDDQQILVGYIAPDEDEGAVDGNIVIKAYIDKNNIAITDTYPEETIREVIATGYSSSACETALSGVTNASTYCASAEALQTAIDTENTLTSAQITLLINAGIVNEYTNGTTSEWVGARTVFTTSEWNALQQNGISFQVKVEANEKTWVTLPSAAEIIGALQTLETTPYGKVYTGANPDNYVWFNNEQWRIIGVYTDAINGDMLKIIKATPYTTTQQYNSSTSSNAWSGSSMQTYLYNNYNSIISDETSRGMVFESGKWNVGATAYNANASTAYNSAIGTPWTGKIGLIASYEYLYGASNDGCWTTSGYDYRNGCYQKDWLFSTVANSVTYTSAWTLSPYSDDSSRALHVNISGYVNNSRVTNGYADSPVVFLKPTITITGGNGQSGETNSYKLG